VIAAWLLMMRTELSAAHRRSAKGFWRMSSSRWTTRGSGRSARVDDPCEPARRRSRVPAHGGAATGWSVADGLPAFDRCCRALLDGLGLEPSTDLRQGQIAVPRRRPELDWRLPAPPTSLQQLRRARLHRFTGRSHARGEHIAAPYPRQIRCSSTVRPGRLSAHLCSRSAWRPVTRR
jgi:hypothetical protein